MAVNRKNRDSERGAVAAEFALLIPILLLLVFGMIQLGLTYQRQEALSAGAREGARLGSLPTVNSGEACTRAIGTLTDIFGATPTCSTAGDCSTGSDSIVVTVTAANTIEIPFYGTSTFNLTGEGDFRCE